MEPFGSRKQGVGQQKGFRRLLGVILIAMVCAVAVAFWAALQHRDHVSPPRDNLPKNIARRQSSITYRRSEQGEQLFTIHAAHTLAYGRGAGSLLEDVHVVIFGKAGDRHDEIQTQRCQYNDETGALACSGEATIVLESGAQIAQASTPSAKPPVLLHTSGVSYDPHGSTVTTNQPVRFQYGLISGAAVGLDYNTQKDQLDLRKSVAIELPLRGHGQSVVRITAGELLYSRRRSQILLRRPVNVSDGSEQLQASAGAAYLNAEGRLTKIVLTGGIHGYSPLASGSFRGTAAKLTALVDPATSQIRKLVASGSVSLETQQGTVGGDHRLFAQTAQISFGAQGKAQTGFASGQVRMVYVSPAGARKEPQPSPRGEGGKPSEPGEGSWPNLSEHSAGRAGFQPRRNALVRFGASAPGATKLQGLKADQVPSRGGAVVTPPFPQLGAKVLTASELDFTFQAGGNVKEAHTVGPGKIVSMPPRPGADRQIITAGQFLASFDSMGRMVRLLGVSNTKVLDPAGSDAPPGRLPRESTSQNLEVVFDPSTESAEVVTQTGNFQFRQGDLRASAHASEYQPGTQQMTLSGHPVIWDSNGRIRAKHMELNLSSGLAHGWGNVQAADFETPVQTARADPKPPRDKQAVPLIILSDRVLDNRNTHFMRFEGNIRAWDGPDTLQSSSLDVYQAARRVSSGFGVVTSLLSSASLTGSGDSGKKPGPSQPRADQPTIIHADHLVYFDVGERAVYRGHVQVTSANTVLHSDSLNVSFSKTAGGQPVLSRAVAVGDVIVTQPGRRATGEQADYFAAPGKIVLTGGPPAIYDENQGFLTARRLTFFVHDASLFADGGSKAPALSKRRIQRQ